MRIRTNLISSIREELKKWDIKQLIDLQNVKLIIKC
jgi:hypothetical protein